MFPVVASGQSDMNRRSSLNARITRMARPIWRDLKLTALMAPAEVPHTLAKSTIPCSIRTSRTPAVKMPR